MKVNGVKAWFLAARPKTLTGAAAPVLMGGAFAFHSMQDLEILPFLLCLLFAFIMQIDSNFVNDYFDFLKGSDREDRLGPDRACAQGWVTVNAMRIAIALTTLLACIVGFPLILWGGLELILVGIVCVLFCFLYTTRLSYLGYGDLLVLIFFGVVPVCITYYVLTGSLDWTVCVSSIACGVATDCLLMVNNYRDRNQDVVSGKRTLVVRFGKTFGLRMYLWLGITAFLLGVVSLIVATRLWYAFLPLLLYVCCHLIVYRKMTVIDGKALNAVLGATARNILLFAVIFSLSVCLNI
jgi:1,4-dihydroxy-2-naphthoate octaprenyltransferase